MPATMLVASLLLAGVTQPLAQAIAQDNAASGNDRDVTMRQINAEPSRVQIQMPNEAPTLNFDFEDSATGWLREDGTMHLRSPVAHRGLLCGTYELGLRFGDGKPDCSNIEWLTPVTYLTRHQQCNSAIVPHEGTANLPGLRQNFSRVSCAQLVVRCKGRCQFTLSEDLGDSSTRGRDSNLTPSY